MQIIAHPTGIPTKNANIIANNIKIPRVIISVIVASTDKHIQNGLQFAGRYHKSFCRNIQPIIENDPTTHKVEIIKLGENVLGCLYWQQVFIILIMQKVTTNIIPISTDMITKTANIINITIIVISMALHNLFG